MRRKDLVPVEFPPDWAGEDIVAADGTAAIEMPVVEAERFYLIERIVVSNSGIATTTARVYVVAVGQEQVTDNDLVDGTPDGLLDVADLERPIRVPAGKTLRIRWTTATVGSVSRARIQYLIAKAITREA